MDDNQTSVNDEELNAMIANLQKQKSSAAATTNSGGAVSGGSATNSGNSADNSANSAAQTATATATATNSADNSAPTSAQISPDLQNQIETSANLADLENSVKSAQNLAENAAPTANNSAPNSPDFSTPNFATNSSAGLTNSPNSSLEEIKRDALSELRPLVDKLDLPADEKFDTLLLMIRTTDDSTLIPAAHVAATQIADDTRRAQALLDVIKEIDFFAQNK